MSLVKCTECGGTVSDTAKQCPHCGAPIIKCPVCGKLIPVGDKECPYCGSPAPARPSETRHSEPPRPDRRQRRPESESGIRVYEAPRRRYQVGGVVVVVILLFLLITCPRQRKHEQVVHDRISAAVSDLRDSTGMGEGVYAIANVLVDQVTKVVLGSNFEVDNYLLFSVGKIHLEGKTHVITLGVANHVFCFVSKDDLKKAILSWKGAQRQRVDSIFDIFKHFFGIDGGNDLDEDSDDSGHNPLDDLFGGDGTDDAPDDTAPDNGSSDEDSDSPDYGTDDRTI